MHTSADPARTYPLVEFPPPAPIVEPPPILPKLNGRHPENIGRQAAQFLAMGAPEGERNARAFSAACELAANGFDQSEAERLVLEAAAKCGLPESEAIAAVKSAYKKERTPSRVPVPDQIGGGVVPGESAEPGAGEDEAPGKPGTQLAPRYGVSNVRVEWRTTPEGPVQVTSYRRVDDVSRALLAATKGWPKCAAGILFSVREAAPGFLPSASSVRYFGQPVDLWAWVSEVVDPYWSRAAKVADANNHPRTPATKEEFHRHLRDSATQRYLSVSILPHEPPVPGVYYVPCELPTATGRRLAEFLAMLNPETEQDRQLMLACLLTPLWGGPMGGRPLFVFDSSHGRGCGKTATAQAIADVFGGAFRVSPKEDWDMVKKRLMSDRALSQRVVLIDNVRNKLGGSEIEEVITASTIDGWRPYHGNFSRPNDLTWIVTQNAARGTQDIATRAVIIRIGAPRHDQAFVSEVAAFIEAHRPELIADLLARLQEPPRGVVSKANRDRFQAWQDGPLARCDDPDALAALIGGRRAELDSDSEEAEEIARAITEWVGENKPPADKSGAVRITRDQMRDLLLAKKIVGDDMGKRGVYGWICNMLGKHGPLAQLSDGRSSQNGDRCWLWEIKHDIPV